jgi:hypothetical protein
MAGFSGFFGLARCVHLSFRPFAISSIGFTARKELPMKRIDWPRFTLTVLIVGSALAITIRLAPLLGVAPGPSNFNEPNRVTAEPNQEEADADSFQFQILFPSVDSASDI